MRYFGYMPNDFINGEGVCVSVWMAGCPHKCPGCHNSNMWDYRNGYEIDVDVAADKIIGSLRKNKVSRNLSILGGEPLAPYNKEDTLRIIKRVKEVYPRIKIFVWTGYVLEDIKEDPVIKEILNNIDTLIDGPYVEELRDISLPLRGSSNQRILHKKVDF